jgi:hypothetical protein
MHSFLGSIFSSVRVTKEKYVITQYPSDTIFRGEPRGEYDIGEGVKKLREERM